MKKFTAILGAAFLALFVALACKESNSVAGPDPTPVPTATATPVQPQPTLPAITNTPTPTLAPSATPTPSPTTVPAVCENGRTWAVGGPNGPICYECIGGQPVQVECPPSECPITAVGTANGPVCVDCNGETVPCPVDPCTVPGPSPHPCQ